MIPLSKFLEWQLDHLKKLPSSLTYAKEEFSKKQKGTSQELEVWKCLTEATGAIQIAKMKVEEAQEIMRAAEQKGGKAND